VTVNGNSAADPASDPADLARRVLDDFPLPVAVTDTAGTVLLFNHEAERALGFTANEIVGASIARLRASGRRESAMLEVEETLRSGRWSGEIRARHKDGRVFPAQVAWSVVRSAGDPGQVDALVVVIRDLSPERRRETRLMRAARERSIGQMAGRIAHEFNNLLGGIVSAADFAISDGSVPRMRRALEQCLAAAERATRVTHLLRLLAFETHPPAARIEVDHLLDHLLRGIGRRAEEQGVEIVREWEPAPAIVAPVGLIEQAINAVLQNALEAMPDGGRLTIGLAPLHGDAVITVEDTGPGIPREMQSRIFEPFFSTKDNDLGADVGVVGLGLALAHRVLEDLDGQITLTSRPGRGTVFVLVLPGAPDPADAS